MKIARRTFGNFLATCILTASAHTTLAQEPPPAIAIPSFEKAFSPNTIGVGATTTLTFTITNNDSEQPLSEFGFVDALPVGQSLTGAAATTDCPGPTGLADVTLGGDTVTVENGVLPPAASCTVVVDVKGTETATNTSGAMTYAGSSEESPFATALLSVDTEAPRFSKTFSLNPVTLGGTTTLTFTIENPSSTTAITDASFSDQLPPGLTIASPANAQTTCAPPPLDAEITAPPGGTAISFSAFGTGSFPVVATSASCTVDVDVTANAIGVLYNQSSDLQYNSGQIAGAATASLTVTGSDNLLITKEFTDDPVSPGGSATLRFNIANTNRAFSATAISFEDDLDAMLSGATYASLISNTCGGAVSGETTATLGFTGGILSAEQSCIIEVSVAVPASATSGSKTNNTTAITGTIDSSPVTGNAASNTLSVVDALPPIFFKSFTNDPVADGSNAELVYTIQNPNATAGFTDIQFDESLSDILNGARLVGSANTCAATVTETDLFAAIFTAEIRDGALLAGSSCTITLQISVPGGTATGSYPSTSGELTATSGASTVSGGTASDNLQVNGSNSELTLVKAFASDTVVEGGQVDVTFALALRGDGSATEISFTDDLQAFYSGTTFETLVSNDCGGTVAGLGTSSFGYSGGSTPASNACEIRITLQMGTSGTGALTNTSSELTANLDGGGAAVISGSEASDDITVLGTDGQPLILTKTFIGDSVIAGDTATLEFTITNPNTTTTASSIGFTDDLDNTLPGLVSISGLQTNICGTGSSITGTDNLTFSGGTLAAGGTETTGNCTFSVVVQVPSTATDGSYTNVTSGITSNFPIGNAAVDVLNVNSTVLELTKTFTNQPVLAGTDAELTFAILNNADQPVTGLTFSDNFDAMIPGATFTAMASVNSCGGTGTSGGLFSYSGGTIPANSSCTITIPVSIPAATASGDYPNTTSDVTGTADGLAVSGSAATDTLTVRAAGAPTISKAFINATDPIRGETATLEFTILNNDATSPITDIGFSDDLNAMLTGATASGLPANPCGAGSTLSGSSELVLAGANIAAGSSCIFSVTVDVPGTAAAGDFLNTTSDLFVNGLSVSGPASATLTVAPSADLAIAITDAPDPATPGSGMTYTVDISNAGPDTAENVVSTFNLPGFARFGSTSGCAEDPNGAPTCTLPDIASGESAQYTISADIAPGATGSLTSDASVATSTRDTDSGNDTDSETTALTPDADIAVTKVVDNATPWASTTVNYSIRVTNLGSSTDTSVSLADTFPSDLICTYASSASVGASGNTASGSGNIAETGLTLAPLAFIDYSAACAISAAASGVITNTATATGSFDSDNSNDSASAAITVTQAPGAVFSKAFAAASILQGNETSLSFLIDASAALIDGTGLAFTDPLPGGIVVAANPGVSSDCGGTITANAGDATISLGGGTVTAGSSCAISVNVRGDLSGTDIENVTSDLTSTSLGSSGPAQATITVQSNPLDLAIQFTPDSIQQIRTTTLSYTFTNGAAIGATGITLGDTLPAGLQVSGAGVTGNTCGGTVSAAPRDTAVSLSGGTLGAGLSCTFSVAILAQAPGSYPNTTETQTSSLGDSVAAADTLEVTTATFGNITIIQNADTDDTFGFTSAEPSLNFSLVTVDGTARLGPVEVGVGSYVVTQTRPQGFGNVGLFCDDSDSVGDAFEGVLTINVSALESVTCTFVSIKSDQVTIELINRFMTRRANLILSNQPELARRLERLNRGFGDASPVTFRNGDLAAMLPFTFNPLSIGSGSYRFSTSLAQVDRAAASIALAHDAITAQRFVENRRFDAWVEMSYQKFDDNAANEGHFGLAYAGIDYLVNRDVLIGAMLQFDSMEDADAAKNNTASGAGWMFGPYITSRLAPNLYFDARLAYGKSNNQVSPFNTYTDKFDGERWLVSAGLTGEFRNGPWTIRPAANLSYFEETQEAYTDSLSVVIPSQTVALGQIKIGPTISGRFETENGVVYQPSFTLDGIYNFGETRGVTVTDPSSPQTDGFRARLKAGVNFTNEMGTQIGISGIYDGIGRSDYESIGLSFDLNIPLYKAKAR